MIANLKGIYETVEYTDGRCIQMYDNTEVEAYPSHWHSAIEMIMPFSGTYSLQYDGSRVCMQEGDVLLICPGALHSFDACEGGRYIFQAEMSSVTQLQSVRSFLTLFYPGVLITPQRFPDIHPRVRALMAEIADEYHTEPELYEASIYAKLLEIIVLIRRSSGDAVRPFGVSGNKQKEYLEKFMNICNYINDHCTEDLCLDDIAERTGFSKYHFSRLFKQFSNVSFYRYLNQKRIEHAERLLINPQISVTEISLSSGFTSLSSFIRMFKQIKGCTPSEYRALSSPDSSAARADRPVRRRA